MADPEIDVFFTGAAVILREHGFGVLADEITTMWSASRATVNGQATRIMELEAEREGLYRKLNPPDAAAPSPAVDREALATVAHGPQVPLSPIEGIPSAWQAVEDALDRLIARYDIRERGETAAERDGAALDRDALTNFFREHLGNSVPDAFHATLADRLIAAGAIAGTAAGS